MDSCPAAQFESCGLRGRALIALAANAALDFTATIRGSEGDVEEERRLFYVAVTRAMDELYLTWPQMRLNANYGEMMQRPSRFLGEIPERFLELWDVHPEF